ncbi:glycosyltransferase family 87 protein [Abditibacterium utsteinense]|nr:glycosyltransferase family 87 protein [Abditibacterium utsteinense]
MMLRSSSSFFIVSALCCLAIAGAAIFLAMAGGSNYLGSLDFRVYLTAGKMALDGTGAKFYDLPTQFATQSHLWPQMTRQSQLLPFLAPPFVGVLFAPLALLSPLQGYVVWTSCNAALLWLLARGALDEIELDGRQKLVALALLLTFTPALFAVMQGQVSLFVVFAFFQSWKAAKSGRDWQAGIWFSVLLIRPQLVFIPVLILMWKGRWKLLGGLASGAAVLGLVSLFLVGWHGLKNYANLLGAVSTWQNIYGVQPQQMQTYRGFLHALLNTNFVSDVHIPWLMGIAFAVALLFWCWRGSWNREAARFDRQWAALGIVALFCCPYLYSHDLSLLSVCGVLIFRAARLEKSRLVVLPAAGYGVVLLWAISLAVLPRTLPWVALFEGAAIGMLAWSDRERQNRQMEMVFP